MRGQRDARERPPGAERGVGPRLRPAGADEHHSALGDPAVGGLPPADVVHREVIAGRLGDLIYYRNDHQRPDGERRRQLVDGGIVRAPVGRRIELGAELVGGEHVAGGLEAVLVPAVRPPGLGIHGRAEGRALEAGPDGDGRDDGVGQVHVLGAAEGVVVDAPERRRVLAALGAGGRRGAGAAGGEGGEGGGQQQGDAKHAMVSGSAGGSGERRRARRPARARPVGSWEKLGCKGAGGKPTAAAGQHPHPIDGEPSTIRGSHSVDWT